MFAVGLLAAAWTQERGGTPQLSQLFLGFRSNLRSLLPIGIFFVVGVTAAVFASSLVDGGKLLDLLSNTGGTMKEEDVAAALADGSLQAAMLFSALLSIPVLIATWWAPALVVFQNAGAGTALAVSLRAAIANIRPLAVYVLGVFFFAAALPALADRRAGASAAGTGIADRQLLLIPYGIFLAATLHISDYVSYRDVFHAGETLAPLSGQRLAKQTLTGSTRLELRVFERQPLDAGIAEIDLHARVRAAAFGVDDHAESELRMLDALADAPCGCRGRRLRRASDAAPFGVVDVDGTAAVRRQPLHEVGRQLGHEARRNVVARLPVQHPALRVRDVEPPPRPRDRDVHEPALFLEAVGLRQAVLVREQALLESGHEHRVELETLGRMHGHQLQRRAPVALPAYPPPPAPRA